MAKRAPKNLLETPKKFPCVTGNVPAIPALITAFKASALELEAPKF